MQFKQAANAIRANGIDQAPRTERGPVGEDRLQMNDERKHAIKIQSVEYHFSDQNYTKVIGGGIPPSNYRNAGNGPNIGHGGSTLSSYTKSSQSGIGAGSSTKKNSQGIKTSRGGIGIGSSNFEKK